MAAANDYIVKDISLAEWGRKELTIAEIEMPGLMATRLGRRGLGIHVVLQAFLIDVGLADIAGYRRVIGDHLVLGGGGAIDRGRLRGRGAGALRQGGRRGPDQHGSGNHKLLHGCSISLNDATSRVRAGVKHIPPRPAKRRFWGENRGNGTFMDAVSGFSPPVGPGGAPSDSP